MSEPETYTVAEVAAKLDVSIDAIYDECRRGRFPHVRIGRRVVIPRRRFEAWLNGLPPKEQEGVESSPLRH